MLRIWQIATAYKRKAVVDGKIRGIAGNCILQYVRDCIVISGHFNRIVSEADYYQPCNSVKAEIAKEAGDIRNKLNNAKSVKEIDGIIKSKNGAALDKKTHALLAFKQFGVGRAVLDYSELTVKNISITGLNVEYQSNMYAAFAAGQVDYRFRDFIVNPLNKTKQNLIMGRYGWVPDKNKSIILSVYTGTKQYYSNISAAPSTAQTSAMNVIGYGLEFNYHPFENVDFTAEVVKSSVPYRGTGSKEAINKAFAFNDHNNEAFSFKTNIIIPSLHSTIKAFYKEVGANFQSYSIFSNGSRQASWGVRLQQYIWDKQLSFTAQIKKNDFDNPLLNRNYSSASTLKSVQAVFRKRKWPLITMAYMPTSQLTKDNNLVLSENIFYAFSSSLSQSYRTKKSLMNTTVFFNRFNTRSTDSGFVFFGAKSLQLNHDIQAGKTGSHSAIDFYTQTGLTYYTVSQNIDMQITSVFSFGLGAKRAMVKDGGNYWGASAQVFINIKKLGSVQTQYEKGFLPDYTGSGLTVNNWGRVVWIKTF